MKHYSDLLKEVETWRKQYNPMRGLTLARIVSLFEEGLQGRFPDLMWLYAFLERRDATLRACRRRRRSALVRVPWSIRTVEEEGMGPELAKLADRQKVALRKAYEAIDNVSGAIRALGGAEFRGFAHLEKHRDAQGRITHLEPVPQWFWHRPKHEWLYDPTAQAWNNGTAIDPAEWIVREVEDPINEVAAVAVGRKGLSQKDWDAWIDTFGIKNIFAVLPPNTPADKLTEYLAMAEAVISGGRGALPHGADVKISGDDASGADPFGDHLEYQDSQIVLAATGGKLTMLTESGSGTLAGGAHADTFDDIAAEEAGEIAELFQNSIDREVLDREFPGAPRLAYFSLAHEDQEDADAKTERAMKLSAQGYRLADAAAFGEDVGVAVVDTGAPKSEPAVRSSEFGGNPPVRNSRSPNSDLRTPIRNRAPAVQVNVQAAAAAQAAEALQADFKPVAEELSRLLALVEREDLDDDAIARAMDDFQRARLPALLKGMGKESELDSVMARVMGTAAAGGLVR